jgi:thiamine-phosphate pyrophosphorylase
MSHFHGEFQRRDLPLGPYIILDRNLSGLDHIEAAQRALQGGAQIIQLRDKTLTFEELVEQGRRILELTRASGSLFLINDNPYLAAEIDADGVHIGQEDIPADIAREIVGPEKLVGLSTHNRKQARAAELLPVDYIGVGPIYPTKTKSGPYPPMSVELVRWVAANIRLPHVAIGGITLDKIEELRLAGAKRAAVISDIMGHPSISDRVRLFLEAFEKELPS